MAMGSAIPGVVLTLAGVTFTEGLFGSKGLFGFAAKVFLKISCVYWVTMFPTCDRAKDKIARRSSRLSTKLAMAAT